MITLRDEHRGVKAEKRYGRLVVLGKLFRLHFPTAKKWACVVACDCGETRIVQVGNVVKGDHNSCGCTQYSGRELRTHGMRKTPLYTCWLNMRLRCNYPKFTHYGRYGGRGIRVCEEWDKSFEAFRDWALANGYDPQLEIDREDNDGNYEPSNCRFVTSTVNMNNTSANRVLEAFGEKKTMVQWFRDERCVVTYNRLATRLDRGWEPERAIATPPKKQRQAKQ